MRAVAKRWVKRVVLALAGFVTLAAACAWADGTLGLDEVLTAVAKAPKLVAEIRAELDSINLKPGQVTCIGARHGNHWKYLGGSRAAPYQCKIGRRSLKIEADRVYFDARGKLVGDLESNVERAKSFRENNFRWSWTP
jgi:hypothetical protein